MKNWKTTISGLLAIATTVWRIVNGEPVSAEELGMLAMGAGLLTAKDGDVTGVGSKARRKDPHE